MTSIPSSPRHSILNIKDLQKPHISFPSPPVAPSSQYSNMRVTDRLHRYRSLKREWNEVAATIHIDSSLTLKSDSPIPNPDILPPTHEQIIQEYIAATIIKEKTSLELDPLHSQIQKDLIKLRKMIKSKRKKHSTNVSSKTNTNNRPSGDAVSNLFSFFISIDYESIVILFKKSHYDKNLFSFFSCHNTHIFSFQ